MATVRRVAPIFPVHDLDEALKHYERLGFGVRAWSGGNYGFAVRDGIEIHLGVTQPEDRYRHCVPLCGRRRQTCRGMAGSRDRCTRA